MKNLIFSLFYIEILFLCRYTHVEIQSHEILFKEKFKTIKWVDQKQLNYLFTIFFLYF